MKRAPEEEPEASERRWAAAEKLATGVENTGAIRESRRKWLRRMLLLLVVTVVVAAGAGALIAIFSPHRSPFQVVAHDFPVASWVLMCVGLVIIVVGYASGWKNLRQSFRGRSIATPLTRSETRLAVKMIYGRIQVDESKLTMLSALARQMSRSNRGAIMPVAGFSLFEFGFALVVDDGFRIFYLAGGLFLVVVIAVGVWQYSLTRAFVKRNPVSTE